MVSSALNEKNTFGVKNETATSPVSGTDKDFIIVNQNITFTRIKQFISTVITTEFT